MRQPESAAAFAAGYQRKEDPVADRLGNARAVVLDQQRQRQPVAPLGQRHAARDARRSRISRLAEHAFERLRRVAHDVEHRLRQLLGIAVELGQADVEVATESRARGNSACTTLRTRARISWMLTCVGTSAAGAASAAGRPAPAGGRPRR